MIYDNLIKSSKIIFIITQIKNNTLYYIIDDLKR